MNIEIPGNLPTIPEENNSHHGVLKPEQQFPLQVRDTEGKMRNSRLSDFEEVWDYACRLKAHFLNDEEIQKEVQIKYGLMFPKRTYESMVKGKMYAPRIDKYRKLHALGKIRQIPNAYKFKRLEKLSEMMDNATDARDVTFLDEAIRRNMQDMEDILFDSTSETEMSPRQKKKLILQAAFRLLNDDSVTSKRIEDLIIDKAEEIKKIREYTKAQTVEVEDVPEDDDE